ncbi:hypothetical protein OSB04_017033 [Centaurea solstitialis]|uniref:Uncharacterized protein n=1 Tax=Centaurea solstitialis TaxID=347529 RepID=A0AA38T260_9ASTR|nr:hypothetical protein OSB04_017033 [Centaurea solstitialis]
MTRCLMKAKKVPNQFWGEATRHATYIINRTPTRALVVVTPYEKFYGQKPNLEGLKEPGWGGVRLFNPEENKIIISCNVSYNEKIAWNWDKEEKELHEGRGSKKSESGTFVIPWLVTNGPVPPNPSATEPTATTQEPVVASPDTTSPQSATSPAAEAQTSTKSEMNKDHDPDGHSELEHNPVRRSNRVSVFPVRLHDYELNMYELMLTCDEEPKNFK